MDKFTKDEIRELIVLVSLGTWVRESLLENDKWQDLRDLEEKFFEYVKSSGNGEFFEEMHGGSITREDISEEIEDSMEEYIDKEFWFNLYTQLGKRDFLSTLDERERKEVEKHGWLPEKVYDYYKKYEEEFDNHGLQRLKIVE